MFNFMQAWRQARCPWTECRCQNTLCANRADEAERQALIARVLKDYTPEVAR